jgi:hypothetical protein
MKAEKSQATLHLPFIIPKDEECVFQIIKEKGEQNYPRNVDVASPKS